MTEILLKQHVLSKKSKNKKTTNQVENRIIASVNTNMVTMGLHLKLSYPRLSVLLETLSKTQARAEIVPLKFDNEQLGDENNCIK